MNAFVSINRGFGGAEKLFDTLYTDLQSAGLLDASWTYERHDLSRMSRWESLRALWRLRGRAVVLNMSVLGIGVFPLVLLRLLGCRVLLYPHVVVSPAVSRPRLWLLRLWLQRLSAFLASSVVAISEGNHQTLARFVPARKLVTVFNYVNCENRRPAQPLPHRKEVAIIGRLQDQHKQQLTFVHRHHRFLKAHGVILHLFGSGPDETALRQSVRDYGLESQVIFHGWCDEDAIFERPFPYVLNLSRWEGLPLSIMETIYHDRVVLLSDIPGNQELADPSMRFSTDESLERLLKTVVVEGRYDLTMFQAQKQQLYERCNKQRSLGSLSAALRALLPREPRA